MPTLTEVSYSPVVISERNYSPHAVVDWVAFVVKLERASHGGYLKRQLESMGVSRAEPLNMGAGSAATEFRITLQHPQKYDVIREAVTRLEKDYGFAEPPVVDGIEVSVDFWPKDVVLSGREITERLMRSITPPEIYSIRLAKKWESMDLPDRRSEIDPEKTLYIRNIDDSLLWRVYWKRTDETFVGDEGKRVAKPLPESEWRARAEVCLQGKTLAMFDIHQLDDLESFRFERLHTHGYFKFCRKVADVAVLKSNIWVNAVSEKLGIDENSPACVLGMFAMRDKRRRSLKLSRYLETDMELTEAARQALRSLTRRF